jgi:hypothetical protein
MSRPPDDAEALIAALAQQARSGSPAAELDPEPEELLEYLAGRLPPEEEERIGRRLVASPEAARALLDLADFEAAGAAAEGAPSELAVLAGWQDLKKRLPVAPAPRFRRFPPLLSSVAAALLVSTLSLSVLAVRQREELRRPVANVPTLELDSGSRAAGEQALELPAGHLLRLVIAQAEHCLKYEAVIQGPERRDPIKGLEVDGRGNLTVVVPVEPGAYGLRLQGCGRELGEYRFRITADGG